METKRFRRKQLSDSTSPLHNTQRAIRSAGLNVSGTEISKFIMFMKTFMKKMRAVYLEPQRKHNVINGGNEMWKCGGCLPTTDDDVSWDDLVLYGHNVYEAFQKIQSNVNISCALRERLLRGETLCEALTSADELLTWVKLMAVKKLPIWTWNPIVATSSVLLDNLKLKLEPMVKCILTQQRAETTTLVELLERQSFNDITCITTLMFVTVARIVTAVQRGDEHIAYENVSESCNVLEDYTPGACEAGVLGALMHHGRYCNKVECKIVCWPEYVHHTEKFGKFFRCSEFNIYCK
ncbi:unknown [Cercopithecine alphaherpesvirus 9]|uniref:Uncharacterized protein n=2 Tax=Cercopithecine alphaherpesvirus 9 TaxID=35246 RepID=A0A2D0TCK9_CHV9D|nr:multifunctional expression regulator-related protein [Cercopithecine alphaherpesvirus 9]AAF36992.1 unknown [Cercopithecine alphaherpesvirus 9]AAG27248.1 unknown [Cercopithecine alphaherpesvirus 9]